MPPHPRPEPVLILGMHRSGTSCLAGCLQAAGLWLGEVNTSVPFNKKGTRENVEAITLHDTVLADNGGRWDQPPAAPVWSKPHLEALSAFIAEFPADRKWGVKDPRTLFLLDGWEALTAPRFVGTFRHPEEVAKSLLGRAEAWGAPMEKSKAMELWHRYNTALLSVHERAPFALVRYGAPGYIDQLAATISALDLDANAGCAFYDANLSHFGSDAPIPVGLEDTWRRLLKAEMKT